MARHSDKSWATAAVPGDNMASCTIIAPSYRSPRFAEV
ncbi:hypothetical protein TPY_1326 [Sulfobacillus acidophilus TPY]|nr:hypothetical protein TPY_1326 [Sulfobacillus acidophilus TPY]